MSGPGKFGRVLAAALAVASLVGLAGGTANAATGSKLMATEASIAAGNPLAHQYQVQQTGYWCSAAAARIALTARGKHPTQSELASS